MVKEMVSKCCHASVTYDGFVDSEDADFCPECKENGCGYVLVCIECDEEVLDDACGCMSEEERHAMKEALAEYPSAIKYGIYVPDRLNPAHVDYVGGGEDSIGILTDDFGLI